MGIRGPNTELGNSTRHSTSGDLDPKSKRGLIAARARNNPQEQFNNLIHHLNYQLVEECLMSTAKGSAPGVDGVTVDQARRNLSWMLPPMIKQIHLSSYRAPPVRRVYIPKPDGQQRPIGVPEVLDRAIQAAMTKILNEIYEQDFLKSSFGFRPELGCHNALATVRALIGDKGLNYVLEVDIRDFFGSLDHGWLRKFLELRIGDRRVLNLIDSWLKAGVIEEGQWRESETGTPQGGSISPLLANIYLHYVLDLWFEKKIKSQYKGHAHLVRYADDFCVFFKNLADLEDFKLLLKTRLRQFGLTVAEDKTHTTNLTPRENEGKGRRRITFLGFNIFWTKIRSGKGWRVTFKTEGKRYRRSYHSMKIKLQAMIHWPLQQQAKRINAMLRGHFNYYGLAGNATAIVNFYYATYYYWRKALSRRSQRGAVNWEQMDEILKQHLLARPKIKVPYPCLESLVRL